MSQYLRLHVGDITFAMHFTHVLEVGQLDAVTRQDKIIWRDQTVPLVVLSELMSLPSSGGDCFVVVGLNSDDLTDAVMVIVDRVEPLVMIPENEFKLVLEERMDASAFADEAWYNESENQLLLRLDASKLLDAVA